MENEEQDLNKTQTPNLNISVFIGSLPSIDEAGIIAVGISENIEPKLTEKEQSFFVAGFQECIKHLQIIGKSH